MSEKKSLKIRIPVLPIIIILLVVAAAYGSVELVKNIQTAKNNHKDFRGNIENLYYYLKKEPKNFEMFSVLNQGDSVALSVWHNYLSTSEDIVRKYENQLIRMAKGELEVEKEGIKAIINYKSSQYKEYILLVPMKEALDLFKEIRTSNEARIEMKKGFNEKEYQEKKKELETLLVKLSEEAKKVKLDLR